jgi:PAS domain S-box-containing protein
LDEPAALRAGDQLRLLVDAVAEYAIFLLDRDGHILTWNTGARRIKGYTPDEIIGQHFSVFYTPEDRARDHPAEVLATALRDGRYEEEAWRMRRDGTRFWADVVITALRNDRGEHIGYGKVTRDLTERHRAAQQLELFRHMVASVRDYAIYSLDRDGYIQTWNAGAGLIKGYTAEEVIGRHFSLFYTDEDRARDHPGEELKIAARDGRYEEEGWRVRKDGTRLWANIVLTALYDDDGSLRGYAKVTRDLTARRAAEQDLWRTTQELERSNGELERFASAAAHDLAEPLHTIAGLADLIDRRHGAKLDDDGREALRHIRGGAERLRGLVDGLLAYSRASHGAMRLDRVDMNEVLSHVIDSLRARLSERAAVVDHDSSDLGVVMGDQRLLEAVLQNLVANALKFNEREEPRIEFRAEHIDGDVRLWVCDDGIGIAPEYQERVFGLFSRLHGIDSYPGTGLGLAMCRRIIERHGGEMGVESTPGQGSRFWFTLPAA